MKWLLVFSALISVTASHTLIASDFSIELYGRSYTYSCGYFSNESGDYDITFKDTTLPWGTRVSVIYGWKGYIAQVGGVSNQYFDFKHRSETAAKATAPYTWSAHIEKTLHNRSSAEFLTGIQFVIKVDKPNSPPQYHNGGTPMGYFQAVARLYGSPCLNSGELKPDSQKIPFFVVEKWN